MKKLDFDFNISNSTFAVRWLPHFSYQADHHLNLELNLSWGFLRGTIRFYTR